MVGDRAQLTATDAALAVLRAGGNAVDAAVAAALVLAVVCPYACTLGGDVYRAGVRSRRRGACSGLNGTGRAPAATPPRRGSGRHSARRPAVGDRAGLARRARRSRSRATARAVSPDLIAAGARARAPTASRSIAISPRNMRDRADAARARSRRARAVPAGRRRRSRHGTLFRQPDLARHAARLADEGSRRFYRGAVAERLLPPATRSAGSSGARSRRARSLWQAPIRAPFYGHDVWTMPPNSYGPTLLLQLLALEADAASRDIDPDEHRLHRCTAIEARRARLSAAGRLIADPEHARKRRCAPCWRRRRGGTLAEPAPRCRPKHATAAPPMSSSSTRQGLAVSLIESISAPLGRRSRARRHRHPAQQPHGRLRSAIPRSANCIAPGKRPANTLAPCLVTRGRRVCDEHRHARHGRPDLHARRSFWRAMLACGEDTAAAAQRRAGRSISRASRWSRTRWIAGVARCGAGAPCPKRASMRAGWISFGSIKLARPSGRGHDRPRRSSPRRHAAALSRLD